VKRITGITNTKQLPLIQVLPEFVFYELLCTSIIYATFTD